MCGELDFQRKSTEIVREPKLGLTLAPGTARSLSRLRRRAGVGALPRLLAQNG